MTAELRVLFVTAEMRPLVSAGGLGEAAAGLVAALRSAGVDVTVALPDYHAWPIDDAVDIDLSVPEWAGPATARVGHHPDVGHVAFISVPGIERPAPYVDADGTAWPDNTERFAAFSAAVAALASSDELDAVFDVVHLNDWHTALVPAFLADDLVSVLTLHNLGHQGGAGYEWLHRLPMHREAYAWGDGVNALAGAIATVDRVTTVSPNYAGEIMTEADGMGLHVRFLERQADLVGIRNGIDTRVWGPAIDEFTPSFAADELDGKQGARQALLDRVGWHDSGDPIIGMVTRLVEQKGVDLAFEAARFLEGMRARMVVLGSGEKRLADWARWLQSQMPDRFWFFDGYDVPISHQIFAGADLFLMPSRFEPCGLAQMQAMAYGTVPVVTAVGGLVDTVIDADSDAKGNGFVATAIDEAGVVDALHRSLRGVRHAGRRRALQRRGMTTDWSWTNPANEYLAVYHDVINPAS